MTKEIDELNTELELKNIEIERIRGWLWLLNKKLTGIEDYNSNCVGLLYTIDRSIQNLQKSLDQAITITNMSTYDGWIYSKETTDDGKFPPDAPELIEELEKRKNET